MKNKTVVIGRVFAIFCFSEMRSANNERDPFAPSLWPNKPSKVEAEQFARENVKHTKYEVRPVLITKQVPRRRRARFAYPIPAR